MRIFRLALIAGFLVLVSCGGGSSSTVGDASFTAGVASSTAGVASSTSTVAKTEVTHKVGDTGPGGGIIVYVDEAGFDNSLGDDTITVGAVCLTGRCQYIEMAPTVLEGKFTWNKAINAAENYSTATADDWVLPSLGALNEVCKYAFGDTVNVICNDDGDGAFLNGVGGFFPDHYWSSSEDAAGNAWNQYFGDGSQFLIIKRDTFYVRPVRAF